WRASTILRRLRERDQQTNLLLNFKQNERILREHLSQADMAESLVFLATLERCKADAEQLARFRYSKISTETARLRRRIRRFEANVPVGRHDSSARLAETGLHQCEQGRLALYTASLRTSSVGCRRRGAMLHTSKTQRF